MGRTSPISMFAAVLCSAPYSQTQFRGKLHQTCQIVKEDLGADPCSIERNVQDLPSFNISTNFGPISRLRSNQQTSCKNSPPSPLPKLVQTIALTSVLQPALKPPLPQQALQPFLLTASLKPDFQYRVYPVLVVAALASSYNRSLEQDLQEKLIKCFKYGLLTSKM